MSPDRWQRVKELFGQVSEQAPEQRASFLGEVCGEDEELRREVSSLLEVYQEPGGLLDTPIAAAFADAPERDDPMAGRMIGSYQIIRRIGRGGMGSVYLAERADDQFRRRVAVKAVNPDLVDKETLRRFHNERQTLAVLDHPNIIKLLDGGTTEDGAPYLVMDYVEGQAIDEYCNSHRLSTTERLRLFQTVCSAVNCAHQNLVVHRDLKPSNILITPDGSPKLLDFGIAKLLKAEYSADLALTRTDLRLMTPKYASPEQILGQPITTASDVYSLGVLLYRLLTGFHPYELKGQSELELELAICQTEPEKPSTSVMHHAEAGAPAADPREDLARRLKGDLDMIVLMAMRKEPQRRYPSAEHLSEDIRRHLEGLPVMAAKDTWRYRASKFVGRNKATVAATVAIAVALISSTLIALSQKKVAEKRFQDLYQFSKWVLTDLDGEMRKGTTPARKELVRRGMQSLDALAREAGNDATMQQDLIHGYITLGDIQGNPYVPNLKNPIGAKDSYKHALGIAETWVKSRPNDPKARRELASVNVKLADVLAKSDSDGSGALNKYNQARQVYEDLLKVNPSSREDLPSLMRVWDKIGLTQVDMGDQTGALQSYRRSLEIGQVWFAIDPKAREPVALERQQVAKLGATTGDTVGAEDAIREAIRAFESSATTEPSDKALRNIAKSYKVLAEVLKRTGKLPEALEGVRKSLKFSGELLLKDPDNLQFQIDVHQGLFLLIDILSQNGQIQQARLETEGLLRFLKPLVEQSDASVIQIKDYCELLLTTPITSLQNSTEAFHYAQKAVTMTNEKDPPALDLLAQAYAKKSDFATALEIEKKAIALLPPADPIRGASEVRKMLELHRAGFRSGLRTSADLPQARR